MTMGINKKRCPSCGIAINVFHPRVLWRIYTAAPPTFVRCVNCNARMHFRSPWIWTRVVLLAFWVFIALSFFSMSAMFIGALLIEVLCLAMISFENS